MTRREPRQAKTDLPQTEASTSRGEDEHSRAPDATVAFDDATQSAAASNLGRYELLGRIGQGGMGVVLRVRDPDLGRELAIKTLHTQRNQDAAMRKRFVAEAQIAGQLQHPGIAPVHEVGVFSDGSPYFTMKLVEGETLSKLLRARKSARDDRPRLLEVFQQICQTIAYAHSLGVIHRDLKPANVMVGSFGEVQVMDWGLAKVLEADASDSADRPASSRGDEEQGANAVRTIRHGDSETDAAVLATQAGSIFGTPAYMPPEQARGEVASVDRRADVFALGAILCELLTGRPPYAGAKGRELIELAGAGELTDAKTRIEESGADLALIELCLACLQKDPRDRPQDASVLAQRVREYEEGVQIRLERARTEQAAAEAQAEEQKKRAVVERSRRRVATALAASIMLIVAGGAATAIWVQRLSNERAAETLQQRIRQNEVQARAMAAIDESRAILHPIEAQLGGLQGTRSLMNDFGSWQVALTAAEASWKTASGVVAKDELPDTSPLPAELARLKEQLDRHKQHLKFASALENVRLETVSLVNNRWNPYHSASRYETLLADYDVVAGDLESVAERMRQQPTRFAIAGALDHWAEVLTYTGDADQQVENRDVQQRLFEVARMIDPDPWRDRFRTLATWDSRADLLELLNEPAVERQTAQTLVAACRRLSYHGGDPGPIIQLALARNPAEFWLHFFAGNLNRLLDVSASVGHFRAALALRPESPAVLNELGSTLSRLGRHAEAVECFEKALRLNPRFYFANYNWGESLARRGQFDAAFERFRGTLDVNAEHLPTLHALAECRLRQRRFEEAGRHIAHALEIDPDDVSSKNLRANSLVEQKRYAEADDLLNQIVQQHANSFRAHQLRGKLLMTQGDLPAAVESLRTAQRLDFNNPSVMVDLAAALNRSGYPAEAEQLFLRATQLDPRDAAFYSEWGSAKYDQGKPQEAANHFRRSLELQPNDPVVHANLGNALSGTGQGEAALEQFERAVELDPDDGFVRYVYGTELLQQQKLEAAAEQFRAACQLQPGNAESHCNLGHALQRQGKFVESIEPFRKGHAAGQAYLSWSYPSAWWLEKAERIVKLDKVEKRETIEPTSDGSVEGEIGTEDSLDVFFLTREGRRKAYDIQLKAQRVYQFQLASDFAAYVRIENSAFQAVAYATEQEPGDRKVGLRFTSPIDDVYRVVVSTLSADQTGDFVLTARELTP